MGAEIVVRGMPNGVLRRTQTVVVKRFLLPRTHVIEDVVMLTLFSWSRSRFGRLCVTSNGVLFGTPRPVRPNACCLRLFQDPVCLFEFLLLRPKTRPGSHHGDGTVELGRGLRGVRHSHRGVLSRGRVAEIPRPQGDHQGGLRVRHGDRQHGCHDAVYRPRHPWGALLPW